MTNQPLFIVIVLAMLGVVVILMMGLGFFARGGENAAKNSNRMMRYRIGAQAAAVVLILLYVYLR